MSGHTPGPWIVHRNRVNMVVKQVGTGHYITDNIRGFDIGANARLIAAAPDLLAACIDAENWLDNHGGAEHDPGARMLLGMIRSAIAKAAGR